MRKSIVSTVRLTIASLDEKMRTINTCRRLIIWQIKSEVLICEEHSNIKEYSITFCLICKRSGYPYYIDEILQSDKKKGFITTKVSNICQTMEKSFNKQGSRNYHFLSCKQFFYYIFYLLLKVKTIEIDLEKWISTYFSNFRGWNIPSFYFTRNICTTTIYRDCRIVL